MTYQHTLTRYRLSRSNLFALTIAIAVGSIGAITSGAPSAAADDDSCTFQLSAPHAEQLPGGSRTAVSATLVATKCSGLAQATSATVCITGPTGNDTCSSSPAWSTARAFINMSAPGGTYTGRGQGCWAVFEKARCTDLGPVGSTI
ncbi:hypothetical protein [Mycolicibacterium alvei]|nr:hypothetical protein [Mycolicibacterium alvei]MCV7000767.1 hypothetical protein [Mycolicibacterium alvei]